jgi:hypothetical protein
MSPVFRSRLLQLLLVVPTLLFLVATVQPLHLHKADQPGLYNVECPLAELAAPGGKVTTSPPALQLWVGLEAGAALLAPSDDAPAAPAVATDSRAPPLS